MMKRRILSIGVLVGFMLVVQTLGWAGVVFRTEMPFPNRAEMPPKGGVMMMREVIC